MVALTGGDPNDIRSMIIEEEFRQMVDLGCDEGSLDEAEGELIHGILDMPDRTAESVMTPKEAILSVSLKDGMTEAMNKIRATQFSRVPVYENDPDDIVGILHMRDLFSVMRRRPVKGVRDVENIIRPAVFLPLDTTLEQVLKEFQRLKVHMAIVTDARHKPAGIVTMEDIFAALFEGG
jgi:putative hemolysin